MTDILDLIDNATEHRCACGCGSKLAEAGPSAWFASENCQARWSATRVGSAPDPFDEALDDAERRLRQLAAMPRAFVREPARPRRVPVIDQHRHGYVVYPFIGGPWDGDLRAFRRIDAYSFVVPVMEPTTYWRDDLPLLADSTFTQCSYTKRKIWMNLPALPPLIYAPWRGHGWVLTSGEVSDEGLNEALQWAIHNGWQPWLYAGSAIRLPPG